LQSVDPDIDGRHVRHVAVPLLLFTCEGANQMDVSAAIDMLIDSSDEAIESIDSQIESLEARLQRLKRARSILSKARGTEKRLKRSVASKGNKPRLATDDGKLAYWSELEDKIYNLVVFATGSGERLTCSDVGLNFSSIGRAINKSQRLDKEGSYIVVVS
jgi:hypothetical protein